MKTLSSTIVTGKSLENKNINIRKARTILLMLLFSFFLVSCSNDDDDVECISVETENVTNVNAPETGEVGETINVEVQFNVSNSCGDFNRFIASGTDKAKTIVVEAVYEGCNCNEVIETITTTYQFEPQEPGEYELNFQSTDEPGFITVTVTITEPED